MSQDTQENKRELALKTIAMPADANPSGDIFGGWLLSQMDLAGAVIAIERCDGPVVTVAVDAMSFHEPVFIGDQVSCYAQIKKTGRSSMTVHIESWAKRRKGGEELKVTEGCYTYVAIDQNRKPRAIDEA